MSLNYELTLNDLIDLYRNVATEGELEQLKNFYEHPVPAETNVLATLRDEAQKKVDEGDKRFVRILRTLEG